MIVADSVEIDGRFESGADFIIDAGGDVAIDGNITSGATVDLEGSCSEISGIVVATTGVTAVAASGSIDVEAAGVLTTKSGPISVQNAAGTSVAAHGKKSHTLSTFICHF